MVVYYNKKFGFELDLPGKWNRPWYDKLNGNNCINLLGPETRQLQIYIYAKGGIDIHTMRATLEDEITNHTEFKTETKILSADEKILNRGVIFTKEYKKYNSSIVPFSGSYPFVEHYKEYILNLDDEPFLYNFKAKLKKTLSGQDSEDIFFTYRGNEKLEKYQKQCEIGGIEEEYDKIIQSFRFVNKNNRIPLTIPVLTSN